MASDALPMAAGAVGMVVALWYYLVHIKSHDDDDEVYTAFFNPSASPVATPHAFVKILERIPKGGRVLDLGVGSGVYLEHTPVHKVIRERQLQVDGVDISAPNVAICVERIKKAGLQDNFTAICQDARTLEGADGTYDAILFMESFPVMTKALFLDIFRGVQRYLKPGTGVNYLYHNLGDPEKVGFVGRLIGKLAKPSVKLLLGIDFGRLTMKAEMDELIRDAMPNAPKYTDEILLAADTNEVNIDVSVISNWWYWMGSAVTVRFMKLSKVRMEQHLITLHQAKSKGQ